MGVGKRISELRKKQGMTQEQLADFLGTTRQAVSKWESEKTSPDIDYVIRIGQYFEVSMDFLLLGENAGSKDAHCQQGSETAIRPMNHKAGKFVFVSFLLIGACIVCLSPLFATLYRNYISGFASAYTDANLYLKEWPLCGVVIIGILAIVIGTGGVVWSYLTDKRKQNN